MFQKGEFILFLPKELHPELTTNPSSALRALDFDPALKQIEVEEAFSEPEKGANLNDFIHLFSEKPQLQKLFYFAGHGSAETVGALKSAHYQRFLSFLDQQGCRGLTISSCSSGGESSLLAHGDGEGHFDDPQAGHRFPIIVRSVGDFPTKLQKVEHDLKSYFNELTLFLEEKPSTLPHLRDVIQKVESKGTKNPTNLVKVYFPHGKGIPGGFRPLDETAEGYSLTFNVVQGQRLRSHQWRSPDPETLENLHPLSSPTATLHIEGKLYLEVHTLVTNIPIQFEEQNPKILSMTPGNSHHLFKSIELYKTPPLEYLKESMEFYETLKGKTSKGFFIGHLSTGSDTLEEVALCLSPNGCFAHLKGLLF